MDRDNAVQIFMNFLIEVVHKNATSGLIKTLEKGPAGRIPPEKEVAWSEWFNKLDSQGQSHVKEIVQEAVDFAVFEVLAIFDGVAGGYPIKGVLSDFALYLQTYDNKEAFKEDTPNLSVKLNPQGTTEDLHDIFIWKTEELS